MKPRIRAVTFKKVDGFLYGYDANGNKTYYESPEGYWHKQTFDDHDNKLCFESSDGYWVRREFDKNGDETYAEYYNGTTTGVSRLELL